MMLRASLVASVALLSGCIIIATEKPTTRVVSAPAAEAAQSCARLSNC